MSVTKDFDYFARAERNARDQAERSDSITARIAHLARADEYASKCAALKREPHDDR